MIHLADLLSVGSGVLVGFALGLLGGGGSILATPLLLYVVGVKSPHVAIGTGAFAVSVNAFANLISHSRAGNVKWPCAATFAVSGVAGALAGAALGKAMDGSKLLFLFGLVMVAVAVAMLSPRAAGGDPAVRITPVIALRLAFIGVLVGLLSGFFGIGGGFLSYPASCSEAAWPPSTLSAPRLCPWARSDWRQRSPMRGAGSSIGGSLASSFSEALWEAWPA